MYYIPMRIKIKADSNAPKVRRTWGIKTTAKVKASKKAYNRKRLTVVE